MSLQERNYWIEQSKERVLSNEGRTDNYVKELIFLYDEAAYNVEKEINTLFARFAADNQITETEAAALLTGKEHSIWRKGIEEYMADATGAAKDSKAMLELNTLAMKSRISRKEQLLSNIYTNMIDLAQDGTATLEGLLGDMLKVNYEESCFRLQRGIGLGFHVAKLNDSLIHRVLEYPWSQRHFSEAVWGQCDNMAALCKRELTMGFIQGSGVQQMAKAVNDVMDKGRYAAERLVRTECKRFANEGEILGYRENGIEKYRFLGGSEGGGHCECASLNGMVFLVDEAEAGVNLPPLHPNCLCTIVASFDHSMFDDRKAEPLAENIKFKQWKEKYVDSAPVGDTIKLSSQEQYAVKTYVGSESYKINAALRESRPLTAQQKVIVKDLDSALDKMPDYKGKLYRSITTDGIDDVEAFFKSYVPGRKTTLSAYTSAGTEVYDDSFQIQYIIKSRHAKDLRAYNPGEFEALFKRDTTFLITKVDGHTIYMEEAD